MGNSGKQGKAEEKVPCSWFPEFPILAEKKAPDCSGALK
jgi:hypothetical protein